MATSKATRPNKPRPDFPLYAASNGQWAKKILGKRHHFGVWAEPETALQKYLDEKEDLHAGRKPRRQSGDYVSVADCCNALLEARERDVQVGRRSQRTWDDIKSAADLLVAEFGRNRDVSDLRPSAFADLRHKQSIRKTRYGKLPSPKTIEGVIKNVRQIFNYAYKNDIIEHPVKFGTEFSLPSKKEYDKAREAAGERMFEPCELQQLIDEATPAMKAMVLLGINTGVGNGDLKTMEFRHLKDGWLNDRRRKTGVKRRGKLWDETQKALAEYLDQRPEPKLQEHSSLVFITRHGNTWGTLDVSSCPIGHQFRKLLNATKLRRPGLSFYTLRHTFQTVAGETLDQIAVDYCMGHVTPGEGTNYRQRISDERLERVSDYVHTWLFRKGGKAR